jgi:hypothetical protein
MQSNGRGIIIILSKNFEFNCFRLDCIFISKRTLIFSPQVFSRGAQLSEVNLHPDILADMTWTMVNKHTYKPSLEYYEIGVCLKRVVVSMCVEKACGMQEDLQHLLCMRTF